MTCPKQGREMETVVLHRVGFLTYSCPKQGQDFKPSAAPLYPNMGQVPCKLSVPFIFYKAHSLPNASQRSFSCTKGDKTLNFYVI